MYNYPYTIPSSTLMAAGILGKAAHNLSAALSATY